MTAAGRRPVPDAEASGVPARSVVAIGGGHGLAATLAALRRVPVAPTAVVSVADDGGSTGRLRADSERVAPGDLRKCLKALASESTPLTRVMEHRFESGELKGHSFGNLLLAAMEESEGGLLQALDATARLLGCVGEVLPATSDVVDLVAELAGGAEVAGQSEISGTSGVRTVSLRPRPVACERAVEAILKAEMVVLGPGSLYTSVLAAAVVPGILGAIQATPATVVYICNLRPQAGETEGYSADDHLRALQRHGLDPEVVLLDPEHMMSASRTPGIVEVALADASGFAHDPALLAGALSRLLEI